MIITVDVANREEIQLGLLDLQGSARATATCDSSKKLLPSIHALLSDSHADSAQVKGMVIFGNKGSFTDTRIAITIANSWHVVRNIPVLEMPKDQWDKDVQAGITQLLAHTGYIHAQYSGAPRIG